ncbi:phosphopyruvate hydratase [Patescibacteria group bacterium]|nr:phosphopyruvate hydratase [Patescibacteria group bacterium]
MPLVKTLSARQILNSRGDPTVEVEVILDNDRSFISSCPSGISRGTKEAIEITDKDFSRFHGKEMTNAVKKIEEVLLTAVKGTNPIEQGMIDRKITDLDGTPNKANFGVNAILPVSMAVAKAGAFLAKQHLFVHINKYLNDSIIEMEDLKIGITDYKYKMPLPAMVLLEGGQHAQTNQPFQEFLFIPYGSKDDTSFWEKLRFASETYHNLKELLIAKGMYCGYGEEGGLVAATENPTDALDLIMQAAEQLRLKPGHEFRLGLDVAGAVPNQETSSFEALSQYFVGLANKYPLEILEDPFPEESLQYWSELNKVLPEQTFIIGDDLTVTNDKVLVEALRHRGIDGVIIKPNQIGTITETIRVVKIAKSKGIKTIVSHRGGETNDDFIADLAVGIGADYIKTGGPSRGERVSKYNRLLQIDKMIS